MSWQEEHSPGGLRATVTQWLWMFFLSVQGVIVWISVPTGDAGSGLDPDVIRTGLTLDAVPLVLLVYKSWWDRRETWNDNHAGWAYAIGPAETTLVEGYGTVLVAVVLWGLVTLTLLLAYLAVSPWFLPPALAAGTSTLLRMTRVFRPARLELNSTGFRIRDTRGRISGLEWARCQAFRVYAGNRVEVITHRRDDAALIPADAIRAGLDRRDAVELAALLTSYLPAIAATS